MAREGRITFRQTTEEDIDYLAANLRRADIDEMRALHGESLDIKSIIRRSVACTPDCTTAASPADGSVAVFGIATHNLLAAGVPWLLATEGVDKYARELVTHGRALVARGLLKHRLLYNYVDSRHTASIRWLRRIGFVVGAPVPRGPYRLPFCMFKAGAHGTHGAEAPH